MSNLLSHLLTVHNWRHGVSGVRASLTPSSSPVRLGVLGAAAISPGAFFDPIATHPGAKLVAVAARSLAKAQAQISDCKLGADVKAYGSYDELLASPDVDAVYIPLPNGLHAEWAVRALEAGKDVLVEKPIASNATEARAIADAAARTGNVALEAFHWRFHPAAHTLKAIVDSGDYGNVRSVHGVMHLPSGLLGQNDIRFKYELAGGAAMDLTYVFSVTSYYGSPDMTKATYVVDSAKARPVKGEPRVDEAIEATYTISYPDKPPVQASIDADLAKPKFLGVVPKLWALVQDVTLELDKARITFKNFTGPWLMHSITIEEKNTNGKFNGKKRTEKTFKDGPFWGTRGETWWTTYRYQLEAFIELCTAKKEGKDLATVKAPIVTLEESVKLMEIIDQAYTKAGMPVRGNPEELKK